MEMDFKGKRLLFIGASGHFKLLINKAKEMGIYTIAINYFPNAKGKQYADLAANVDTYDPDLVTEFAKEQKVDGIITSWNEVNLFTSAYVAEKLGVPFFATKEQLDALVTKAEFKKTCLKYDVPVIPVFFMGKELTKQDVEKFEYPVIFKPTDSGGTRGMTILYDGAKVWEANRKALDASMKKEVIIEKYIKEGQLIVIDLAVQDGKSYIVSVADRSIVRTSENAVPLAVSYMYPSKYVKQVQEQLYEPIDRLLKGLNIRNGIISFEAMVSEGKIYLIETQFRFGGTHFYMPVDHFNGVDLAKMMICYALTGQYDLYDLEGKMDADFESKCACQNLQADPGVIERIECEDEITKIPGVDWYIPLKSVGDRIPDDGSTAQNFAKIGIYADSDRELYRIMDRIQHTLKVYDTEGKNLVRINIPKEYL